MIIKNNDHINHKFVYLRKQSINKKSSLYDKVFMIDLEKYQFDMSMIN